MKNNTVFDTGSMEIPSNHLKAKLFFDDSGPGIARYDEVKYPEIEALNRKMLSFFWVPEKMDITRDRTEFTQLGEVGQHIFTSNIKRQILLDSVQGRSPSLTFLRITSNPELETAIQTWSFFEQLHSRSYTHIIRNIYNDPSEVFDQIGDITEIVKCADDISKYYDNLLNKISLSETGQSVSDYELKKALWLCLASVNALEGIRFYVSFACSWAFAENKTANNQSLMEGNAKIIREIARDENLHLALTQLLLGRILVKDDPDFEIIKRDCHDEVCGIFMEAVEQEENWAEYIFSKGSILGLNEKIMKDYVRYIGAKRMQALKYKPEFEFPKSNPLPWTNRWLMSKSVQVAPQETEVTSYKVGAISNDVSDGSFSGIKL